VLLYLQVGTNEALANGRKKGKRLKGTDAKKSPFSAIWLGLSKTPQETKDLPEGGHGKVYSLEESLTVEDGWKSGFEGRKRS